MNNDANERFIKEIVFRMQIQEYLPQVTQMVSLIWGKGFSVSCRYDSLQSVIEWDQKLIRISVKDDPNHRLHSLWSLFHETGHLINGYNIDKRKSETAAWGYAFEIVKDQLPMKVLEFNQFKDQCMQSHGL